MGLFLRQRRRQPEVMDQPDLCPRRHVHALAGLSRINLLSGTTRTFWQPLVDLQRRLGKQRLRILDVACGGGDVVRRLWWRAMKLGLDWRLAGCDISPVSVEHARVRAREQGAEVYYFVHDVFNQHLAGDWDAILCSLFLHHLDDEQAVGLLGQLARPSEAGPALLLVNDLDRSVSGLLLAHLACRLLTTSGVVHTDGPRSVRAAFTLAEARELARRAGLEGAELRRIWPCRWLLNWSRP
jgi:SAM-dependent methyltransferase